ncbi:tumor-associated protein [Musa troglodytarum]|uniref:Tumor-associated protein n=1 Tax=Musa troglodytarum TaxID=320322 RepID=A0A9E7HGR3_9LILI|nr:tumor-associated protein [Musa troglodytarum]
MLSQLLTPRIRLALEYAYLAFAVALFGLLVVMHTNFVQQITGAGLWTQSSGEQNTVELKPESSDGRVFTSDGFTDLSTRFWSNWLGSGAKRSKLIFKPWKSEKELLGPQVEKASETSISKTILREADSKSQLELLQIGHPISVRERIKMEALHFCNALKMPFISFWNSAKESLSSVSHLWGGIHSLIFWSAYDIFALNILSHLQFSGLKEEAKHLNQHTCTLQRRRAKSRHDIRTVNATISAQSTCFGNRWQQLLINSFVGYDTILMNSLLSSPGHAKEFYDLNYGKETWDGPTRFGDYFVTKCSVLIMSLFVFFTTTMSVSFTLRETQSRMLRFTVQLQHHARNHLPTFQLIFVHCADNNINAVLSTIFLALFPAFMQHLILYFWNRFEVPALQRFMRARAQLQQQTGVQITSSTIYTSTLHIARLSLPNGDVADAEPRTTAQASAGTNPAGVPDPLGGPFGSSSEVSNLNSHQTAGAPGTGLLNAYGSLML